MAAFFKSTVQIYDPRKNDTLTDQFGYVTFFRHNLVDTKL